MIQINREVFKERRSDVLRNGTYQSERTCHPDSDRIGDTTSGSEAHSESFRTSESPDSCGVMADRAMGDSGRRGRKGRFDATLLRASVGNSVFSHCPTVDRLWKVTVDSRSQGPATLRADRACVRSVLNGQSLTPSKASVRVGPSRPYSHRAKAATGSRPCGHLRAEVAAPGLGGAFSTASRATARRMIDPPPPPTARPHIARRSALTKGWFCSCPSPSRRWHCGTLAPWQ